VGQSLALVSVLFFGFYTCVTPLASLAELAAAATTSVTRAFPESYTNAAPVFDV